MEEKTVRRSLINVSNTFEELPNSVNGISDSTYFCDVMPAELFLKIWKKVFEYDDAELNFVQRRRHFG